MSVEVRVPAVGESITEGVLTAWEKKSGEFVRVDDPLFELETDKVTMTINAEESGQVKILVEAGSTVEVGQVVATIDPGAPAAEARLKDSQAEESEEPAPEIATTGVPGTTGSQARQTSDLSPAVRRLVTENQLDPARIVGTGKGGRPTKEDVLKYMVTQVPSTSPPEAAETKPGPTAARPAPAAIDPTLRQTRGPLSSIRKRIAQRLVESQQSTATLTTFNEVDMTNVMEWRSRYKENFQKKHAVGLGFMSFFVKASVDALQQVPQFNGQIDGDQLVQNHYYNIGIAVSTDRGLVVPVLRDADQLSFAQIEEGIAELAARAQNKKLTLDDFQGGCFTISNGGIFGSLLSTPILNPPQAGILGMHGIKRRPVAVEDKIEIRPMMYLAVSYDHRLVDGRESVTFLKRIVECIENPERMMLEI